MSLGERIRKARTDKNLTMSDLAKITNTTAAAISRYELGQREPKIDMIKKIATALGVDSNWIIGPSVEEFDDMLKPYMDASLAEAWRREQNLKKAYDSMNAQGQQKAVERVEELARLPENQQEPVRLPENQKKQK